jgi:hypothetical protein
MTLKAAVLNAQCSAATALFDTASLHTADPAGTGANEDPAVDQAALTWSAPSNGVSTATATFTDVSGDWTHIGVWNSSTFEGAFPRTISMAVADVLTVAFQVRVKEDA